jgi:PhnB protein
MEQGEPAVVSVMLIVSDVVVAVGWYTEALGAELLWDLGGVAAMHLQGAPFLLHEAVPGKRQESSPTDAGLTTTRIEVFIEAPEDLVARASGSGASNVEPVSEHDVPWGTHRQGGFTDPFGHRWSIGDGSPLRALPS